jgi:N-acetylated-alpha-linked acidic dipeptidase
MRGPDAVQRGSIQNASGDPTTPAWASTPDARRIARDSMVSTRIPVVPLGYGNAARILESLGGPSVSQAWQGALPFRYHAGDSTTRVRLAVWLEPEAKRWKTITNTFGRLRGTEWPDEIVIAGGHRDSWGPGAADNISGTVSLLEAARAMGTAARQGRRPRRTVIFATWDAEEWGLVGSTEWVESREQELRQQVVAYLNQDMSAFGRAFGASGTPSLYPFIRDVTRTVEQPGDTVTVYAAWRAARRRGDTTEVTPGVMGGGSDFLGFYNHLGLPSIDMGFGGPIGVYHSAYDTWTWMERFGDPGYLSHAAAGRLVAVAMSRLADADVEPFDYAVLGRHLAGLATASRASADSMEWSLPYDSLDAAITALTAAGERLNQVRRERLSAGPVRPAALARVNATLREVEPAMSRAEGLVGRPWRRNLIYASDRNNGYANIALPGIAEALEDQDRSRARAEVLDLAGRVGVAAEHVRRAADLLDSAR